MEALALPFLLLVGSLLALQAAANVQLSTAMTSPFGASALQLGIGAALLLALAAVAGTWLIVSAQAGAGVLERVAPAWIALGLLAGAALPVQGAINARLRAELDAPIAVGALSFVVATAAMAVVLAVALAVAGTPRPQVAPLRRVPWWGWLGGVCGATYVTSVFLLIPEIGAAPTIALTVAGQQLASVLVDRYGLLRLPRRVITRRRLLGVAVLLGGVALVQLP